ncbi:hypothetical protein [Meridianimarinicoccus sp. MJW13]|uniref:hypothetical protein n=1 Tax=Meridianimarinicoccus sp. MJW13 TaxID=2720031 RepID=UPI0018678DC8|nr:hypothetical protein [Fluviibacterium sp. MJW13]
MKIQISTSLLCAALSACGPADPVVLSSDAPVQPGHQELDRGKAFRKAVVGYQLRGDGVDVTVEPDGLLVGTYLGKPFVGSWDYRRGRFCASLQEADLRRAADRRCFRVVTLGRRVILHPVAEG